MSAICRHCRTRKASRSKYKDQRGLCWFCAAVADIRALYPLPANKFNRACHGHGNGNGGYVPPPCPTQALPGTAAKIDALAQRAAANSSLWHPGDATYDTR